MKHREGWLQQFYAVFEPARRDDLNADAEGFIGREGLWQRVWIIEEGLYAGQWACQLLEPWPEPLMWVPEEDLRDVPGIEAGSTTHFAALEGRTGKETA